MASLNCWKKASYFSLPFLFGEAERFDALDENFGGVGLSFDDFDHLDEEVLERHGARVGGLGAAHQFGLDVGWDEFEYFYMCGLELVAQGRGVSATSADWVAKRFLDLRRRQLK